MKRAEETTQLTRTNRTTLSRVLVGDRLTIELRPGPPELLVVVKDGSAAGAVDPSFAGSIVTEMRGGSRRYIARVVKVTRETCEVVVERPHRESNK